MPRGRHRHSPPLHRLLPPLTVAGSATTLAVGAWFSPTGDHAVVLRVLVAATAAAACTGAVLLRRWDRAAGRRVAELAAARVRDEWRTEERIAELEGDAEESREVRRRLEAQLRAKRAELARLRNEHAELLRRYATAESERARALEGRRRLAIEAAAAPKALASPPANPVTADAYRKADEALLNLGRNAARQRAARTAEHSPDDRREGGSPAPAPAHTPAPADPPAPGLVPVAAAVLPYAAQRQAQVRPQQGGFDFFGLKKHAASSGSQASQDLADVVGDEAYAEHEAKLDEDDPQVIDLTAHDETEQLDLRVLRAHS